MIRNSKLEQESFLEYDFNNLVPVYHLYTRALESDVIFHSDEERRVGMNDIAIASVKAGVNILAFTLMSNHFHFIIQAEERKCRLFFDILKESLSLYFSRHGYPGLLSLVVPCFNEITSLRQLRAEIIYVLRNPFVERTDVHPLSHRWSSGYLYFNEFLDQIPRQPYEKLSFRDKRKITMSSDSAVYPGLTCFGLTIAPSSYVDYKTVEKYFSDQRTFLMWMFKNLEAQIETAIRSGERPSFNDDEAFSISVKTGKQMFGNIRIRELEEPQKIELAKKLKYEYYLSNGQLARCINLPLTTVNSLFPLTAKDPHR